MTKIIPGVHFYSASNPKTKASRTDAGTAASAGTVPQRARVALSQLADRLRLPHLGRKLPGPVAGEIHQPPANLAAPVMGVEAASTHTENMEPENMEPENGNRPGRPSLDAGVSLWESRRSSVESDSTTWEQWCGKPRDLDRVASASPQRKRARDWSIKELEFAKAKICAALMRDEDYVQMKADIDEFAALHGLLPLENYVDEFGVDLDAPKDEARMQARNIFTGESGRDAPPEFGSDKSWSS